MGAVMKAAVLNENGLEIQEIAAPEAGPGQLLVKVHAAGLNRADILMASGKAYGSRGGAGTVAGLEWSGEVVAMGADTPGFKAGDRVMCSGAGGYPRGESPGFARLAELPLE
jgi:NADPH2:quinone reductase